MSKDVDLSSKEWTDLVFEGKNKDLYKQMIDNKIREILNK